MSASPETAWIVAPSEELCLDFTNTRYWRGTPDPTEQLGSLGDLLGWCGSKLGLPAGWARSLEGWGETNGAGAASLFAEALAEREAIYRLFFACAAGSAPAPADLTRLNQALGEAPARRALDAKGRGFGWRIARLAPSAPLLLTPVLWSAADLLAGPRLERLRHCANPHCQWLFLDDSKSGNRRWCAMSACGNRAKAHRHYLRKKALENE